ncbi:MAG: polyphosphate kinase 1 [Bacteroidota bacterium]|jgi:polyphosphate kinase
MKDRFIARDISWLSFNGRVLQEANDPTVPLNERIRFLGIFSNNLDEFFRVRVATLKRMVEFTDKKGHIQNIDLIESPQAVLDEIQRIVLRQQNEFNRIWQNLNKALKASKIQIVDDKKITIEQKGFVKTYFDEVVRSYIIPLMIENVPELPYLRDKSLYLAIVMGNKNNAYDQKFSLIEIPSRTVGRFIQLPSKPGTASIILLEDLIRYNLPIIFSHFKFNKFEAHVFKITKDAEIDLDQEVGLNFVDKISKGIKNRRKGKPVRFVYEKEMNAEMLEFLIKKLKLTRKSSIIPGGHIHNFRHFMDFPNVIPVQNKRPAALIHPAFKKKELVSEVVLKKDVMLHFPYHAYDPVIDLLREAAMDDQVISIKITAYRLASNSKVINALINAARNGKAVTVFLELKARFDEEANLEWKSIMEEEGIRVLVGVPNKKVHAKLCIIQKRKAGKLVKYGFISTGNLNEKTAKVYADHCLLTANKQLMNESARIFTYLENWQHGDKPIVKMSNLLISPINMRKSILQLIDNEIKFAKQGKFAKIIIKLNSLTDITLIEHLYKAIKTNVEVHLIVRGILTLKLNNEKANQKLNAISIVDQYLEHARVMVFHNNGNEKVYISSADWMVRNLDYRIEVAVPILDNAIKKELIEIINIQLRDNQKARILDPELLNKYVPLTGKKHKSQEETYNYLKGKI